MLGVIAEDHGDYATATRRLTAAHAVFAALDDRHNLSQVARHLGVVAHARGDLDLAMARYEEALALGRTDEDPYIISLALWNQGLLHCQQGRLSSAADAMAEALLWEEALGTLEEAGPDFGNLAVLGIAAGRPEAAVRLLGTAHGQLERRGMAFALPEREFYDQALLTMRRHLDEPAFSASWEIGRHRTIAGSADDVREVFSAARSESYSAPAPSPSVHFALTSREQDVLALLCQRLTNAEIAERLYLSRRTVEDHISRLLAKLDVANRREAVALAARLGFDRSESCVP